MNARHRQLLAIVATDATFELAELAGRAIWSGKCIHCNARLAVEQTGAAIGGVTIEHIRPKGHGGTDDLENLALACPRCNHQKGTRQDNRRRGDPTLEAYVEKLLQRRRSRWREPEEASDVDEP